MNGKIPYTDKMLSTIFRRKESTVQMAIKTFEQFGMVEIIEGVITIPNWGKHQSTDMITDRRDYMREYMIEYRARQKMLADGKSNSKPNVNLQEGEGDKKEKKNKETIGDLLTDFSSEYQKAFLSFSEMRTKIKKPLTYHAAELILKSLFKLSADEKTQIDILDQSTKKCWQDVYELKSDQQKSKSNFLDL